ncbi:NAD(P)/FAD-dependent oxidoreductase [Bacillus salitolerans]|uniref:NAD(P)/FAD-dependent oxidoreductase n=1 Tax=Bacillus salitolerans TaxID=1437434 RepID=A0ABW4LXM4_9BACI
MKRFLIVGAGILGASTAYHLARAGAEVTIVDRSHKGQATDAAAGIVCPWLSQRRNKAWYELVKGGARYYPELVKELKELGEVDTGYRQVGAISLHTDEDKLEKMADRARTRREDAPEIGEIKILSSLETKKLFPPLASEYGSVHVSGGARVNGRQLRNALLNAAKKLGAKILCGDARLLFDDHTITGVSLEGQRLNADKVIVTGGAWSHELFKPLGLRFLVRPQKAQIVHLEMKRVETGNWPVVMPPNDQYILSFESGRVVIGATHEDEAGFDHRVTAGGMHEVLNKALAVAPGLESCNIVETRVGFRPYTPGFLPIIGHVPNWKGVLVANGLGASGLTSGPYLGGELAKLALNLPTGLQIENYDTAGAIEIDNEL